MNYSLKAIKMNLVNLCLRFLAVAQRQPSSTAEADDQDQSIHEIGDKVLYLLKFSSERDAAIAYLKSVTKGHQLNLLQNSNREIRECLQKITLYQALQQRKHDKYDEYAKLIEQFKCELTELLTRVFSENRKRRS